MNLTRLHWCLFCLPACVLKNLFACYYHSKKGDINSLWIFVDRCRALVMVDRDMAQVTGQMRCPLFENLSILSWNQEGFVTGVHKALTARWTVAR